MASSKRPSRGPQKGALPSKQDDLERARENPEGTFLTTDQGTGVTHTDDSLKAGPRGPTLLEDFHLREKITRFDHERIPERVVHARGTGAHGYFEAYDDSLSRFTSAEFLIQPARRTPVFVRFSTVVGSRGSADTVRDVRGFAVKFYTDEGNFDLVGNNIPVFFIQDGAKFPDFVHAVKPEPDREIPQASSAHDTFWDFVSLVPETTHTVMWAMSDRGIPRSYRMMEGFGVHTFRLVNAKSVSCFVKFHWKPLLGVHSLVWDEAQLLAGKDPDFHRRDLWEAIEAGQFPEWELGVQIVPEEDALAHGFDMLDPTKLLPEELVPVLRIGKMTLDRNPDNFFSEVEQVAFCVANVVPGIDFSNDPLMQARLFSYLDTQLTRLGGPNFAELPINRPRAAVHNHQQDGFGRHTIPTGKANYHPNSVGGGHPQLAPRDAGFVPFAEKLEGSKVRERSPTFGDHFSQATLFFNSLSPPERDHLIEAFQFELGKVERKEIRERVVRVNLLGVDAGLAREVARVVDVELAENKAANATEESRSRGKTERSATGRGGGVRAQERSRQQILTSSPALSQLNTPHDSIRSRKIAVLLADGFAAKDLAAIRKVLESAGATVEIVAPKLGMVSSSDGKSVSATKNFLTACSVFYDAVFIPGGSSSVDTLRGIDEALDFVEEANRHFKPVGATGDGIALLSDAGIDESALGDPGAKKASAMNGIVSAGADGLESFATAFVEAIAQHRHWERAKE